VYTNLGQIEETQAQQKKPKPRFSTYLMAIGAGLFLLGNLGFWIVRGRKNRKKVEMFGKTVAITGILVRGVAEVIEYKAKLA
jgi:hypothetical protein